MAELGDEINKKFNAEWANWQQQSYVDRVQNLSKAFAAAGKELVHWILTQVPRQPSVGVKP